MARRKHSTQCFNIINNFRSHAGNIYFENKKFDEQALLEKSRESGGIYLSYEKTATLVSIFIKREKMTWLPKIYRYQHFND